MPATYYASLIAATRSAVGAAWADVLANGIYHAADVARIPFDEKADRSELPIAILDFDMRPSDWGAGNDTEEGTVTVYRVYRGENDSDLAAAISKCETLRNQLWPNGLTTGQLLEFPAISWSMALEVNRYLLLSNRPFYAVAVIARVTVGEGVE